jgi:hypothetical protein
LASLTFLFVQHAIGSGLVSREGLGLLGRKYKPWIAPGTGLQLEVIEHGPSTKANPTVPCSLRIQDRADPDANVVVPAEDVQFQNTSGAIIREGSLVFAAFQYNGYARSIKGRGNRILALDLCRHMGGLALTQPRLESPGVDSGRLPGHRLRIQ